MPTTKIAVGFEKPYWIKPAVIVRLRKVAIESEKVDVCLGKISIKSKTIDEGFGKVAGNPEKVTLWVWKSHRRSGKVAVAFK